MTIQSKSCSRRFCLMLLALSSMTNVLQTESQTIEDTRGRLTPEEFVYPSHGLINKRPRSAARRVVPATYALVSGNTRVSPGFDVGVTLFRLRPAGKRADPAVVEEKRIVTVIHEK